MQKSKSTATATATATATSFSSPLRVLTRNPPPPPPPPPPPVASSSSSGVVVVGFVGSGPTIQVTHLINRILDANIFGSSSNLRSLHPTPSSPLSSPPPNITYYYHLLHDSNSTNDGEAGGGGGGGGEDKQQEKKKGGAGGGGGGGMLFLHLSSSSSSAGPNLDDDDFESDHLRGMLFMFSVCHVILFLHQGQRFDTQILKKLRILQAAKHALAPFVKSQVTSQASKLRASSVSPPPPAAAAGGGRRNRQSSSISLMSGSGSHPSMLPGQCIPIILFVLCDHLSDLGVSVEDSTTNDLSQNQSISSLAAVKGSSGDSLVMLARPTSKSNEGSLKKKLHSFLDSQIRFLIKKCRILAGSAEPGSRGAGNMNSLPLFSLDASRVVALIDTRTNQRGEPLDFVTSLIEEALNSNMAAMDMFMLENKCQALNDEEIQVIKDFIYRQSDALRGRGALPSNANSGSVAGVGMVAVAAAAAAASAAAGKQVSAPELPSLESWLASSNLILDALLSVEHGIIDKDGNIKRQTLERNITKKPQDTQKSLYGTGAAEAAVYCLESSMAINMKFSIAWCQRALPVAKELYLKDLPSCYPTALHEAQLERALHAFNSMVKGPAVEMFAKRLEDECISIWETGRQLCDAVSLTGKPCMHQRHGIKSCDVHSENVWEQKHSSGYVSLHACPCGRSRRLRDDPFDFDSANVKFNCFADCKGVLPTLVLPKGSTKSPLPLSAWTLLRLGGTRYYEPSKGLLQIGFAPREKFLLKWTISIGKQKGTSFQDTSVTGNGSVVSSTQDLKASSIVEEEINKPHTAVFRGEFRSGGLEKRKQSSIVASSGDTSISFGKGLPSFNMKKPFSEVVAGTPVVESSFPLLQQSKQPKAKPGKGAGKSEHNDWLHVGDDSRRSQRTERIKVHESLNRSQTELDPSLQIGNKAVPVNMSDGEKRKPNFSSKKITLYVGFEHECSYGHRFLLSPGHLMEFDSSYSEDPGKDVRNIKAMNGQMLPNSSRLATTAATRRNNKFTKTEANGILEPDRLVNGHEDFQSVLGISVPDSVDEIEGNHSHVILNDASSAFSLLNRNLPLYMNCPHCKSSNKQDHQNIKFASTVSQLQRIFLVTPPFPTVLATCPVIQFDEKCLPPSIPDHEQQAQFTIGCQVILPPESFLTLRLPFVYGVRNDDGSLQPLGHLEHQPELTAWLVKGTALQVVSMEHKVD